MPFTRNQINQKIQDNNKLLIIDLINTGANINNLNYALRSMGIPKKNPPILSIKELIALGKHSYHHTYKLDYNLAAKTAMLFIKHWYEDSILVASTNEKLITY